MIVSDSGFGDFQLAPTGNHVARCFSVIDLGTQENTLYGGWRRQVFIQWELPNEMMESINGEEAKPFVIGKFYTASLNEKARLRQDLESWRGRAFTEEELRGFDLKNILDKPCMLNVIHKQKPNGNMRADIASISQIPKGTKCPDLVNELRSFDIDKFDEKELEKISEGLRDIITKAKEWKQRNGTISRPINLPNDLDDDIPF
jgi:hypothetical protein